MTARGGGVWNTRLAGLLVCAFLMLLWATSQFMLLKPTDLPEERVRLLQERLLEQERREQRLEEQITQLEAELQKQQKRVSAPTPFPAAAAAAAAAAGGEASGGSKPRSTVMQRGAEAVAAVTAETRAAPLLHGGEDCWDKCGLAGFCDWCGMGNACCRRDWKQDPKECKTAVQFFTAHHECVAVKEELPSLAPLPKGRGKPIDEAELSAAAARGAVGVVVISCKRPSYLKRAMASILKAPRDPEDFPIIISQDAHDVPMTQMVESTYVSEGLAFHMHHDHEPNAEAVAKQFGKVKSTVGYVRIAQHYGFALKRMFDDFGFQQIIFLEEDMEIAPDFFAYFKAMLPLLQNDPQLYCVSAWNDNGYTTLVQDAKAVYRTEFFPGLGWMLRKSLWDEVRGRWAVAFWDEFMRRPDVRNGRQCIRPEVSRSFTFGAQGTSGGQFFNSHLKYIKLNDVPVPWQSEDLRYLASTEAFDRYLSQRLQAATPIRLSDVDSQRRGGEALRILYDDAHEYKTSVAKKFGLMPDEKEGVRRMSYRGVIPFSWQGNRIYLYTRRWPPDLQ